MSYFLSQLEDPQRRADCERHDAADRDMDARLLHRIPAPNEGRDSEECRRATCVKLGLNPDAPLAFLQSPHAAFWTIVAIACSAVIVISLWAARWAA